MSKMSNTNLTRKRYDRLAFFYDFLEAPLERFRFHTWRSRLRDQIGSGRVLEVGVGTGKNFPHYPKGVKITAIDFSPRMLDRARRKALNLGIEVELLEMDVQHLDFPDHFFDTVFATFVFFNIFCAFSYSPDIAGPAAAILNVTLRMEPGSAILSSALSKKITASL